MEPGRQVWTYRAIAIIGVRKREKKFKVASRRRVDRHKTEEWAPV
jgi:hypothetical protein